MPTKYNPTELRFLKLLGDGMPHKIDEFRPLLDDDLSPNSVVKTHVCKLRAKVRRCGRDIAHESNGIPGNGTYRMVRLVVEEESAGSGSSESS